jgi:hypothetical protein
MKKKFNVFGSLALSALVLIGSIFASCGQVAGTSSDDLSLALSAANPPTALNSWMAIGGYAANGGGGGHSVYGNGVFLSANRDDGSVGRSVNNGASWSKIDSSVTTFNGRFIKYLAYLDNTFWAVGQSGHVATSPDGLTWTAVPGNPLTGDVYGIAYDGIQTFMLVTDITSSGLPETVLYYVDDHVWLTVPNSFKTKIDSVAFMGGQFIAVCNDGYIAHTNTPLHVNWSAPFLVSSPTTGVNTNHFKMIAAGFAYDSAGVLRNAAVAVSRYGLAYAFNTDLDASGWTWVDIYPSSLYASHIWLNCVLYDGEKFIVAGQDGGMAYSDPAQLSTTAWTVDTNFAWTYGLFRGTYINGIAFGPGRAPMYVASGGDSNPVAARTTP